MKKTTLHPKFQKTTALPRGFILGGGLPKVSKGLVQSICFYCGQVKGVIPLSSVSFEDGLPSHVLIDKVPCATCQDKMKENILFIVQPDGATDPKSRTGTIWLVPRTAVGRCIKEPMLSLILETGFVLVEQRLALALGFK